jgi:DNA polymerase
MEAGELVIALQQQMRADQLLGLRFLPLSAEVIEALGRVGGTATLPGSASPTANLPLPGRDSVIKPGAAGDRGERLARLDALVKGCRKCVLCETRNRTVFGQGNPNARLVFVGEGPGYEEDQQGLAFVGAAGQLLTRMILAMGLTRDDVFICNVVKCRPPGNRTPAPEEIQACHPYLREQLEIIAPEVIVALGAPASQTLLNTGIPIGRLRGRFHDCCLSGEPGVGPVVPLMPTYHPAYLLRTPGDKGKTWDDLQQVMARLNLPLVKAR